MDKVSVVECGSYELEEVYAAVKKALCQINFVIPENKMVLLKPNLMSQNSPEQHSVTHYALVDALCRMLKEKNCRIVIGDSSAFYQKGLTKEAFKTSKIKEVADKYGATLIAFEEAPLVLVPIDIGRTVKTVPSRVLPAKQNMKTSPSYLQELYLPQILFDVDLVINVCKLKTHGSMRLSGAIKNMFGCLPGGYKQRIHMWVDNKFELSDVILNIHESVKPALSVMDAVYSLDGGPSAIGNQFLGKQPDNA